MIGHPIATSAVAARPLMAEVERLDVEIDAARWSMATAPSKAGRDRLNDLYRARFDALTALAELMPAPIGRCAA